MSYLTKKVANRSFLPFSNKSQRDEGQYVWGSIIKFHRVPATVLFYGDVKSGSFLKHKLHLTAVIRLYTLCKEENGNREWSRKRRTPGQEPTRWEKWKFHILPLEIICKFFGGKPLIMFKYLLPKWNCIWQQFHIVCPREAQEILLCQQESDVIILL